MRILIPIFLILLLIYIFKSKRSRYKRQLSDISYIEKFRKRFKSKFHISTKISFGHSDFLLSDPNNNISINPWDKEESLLEKADIHKIRLSKFGKSKMNGQVYFKGPKGGVYTLSESGNKKYV